VRDLSQYDDISEYVLSGLGRTESDNESETPVIEDSRSPKLPETKSNKKKEKPQKAKPSQKSVKLIEMGPRLRLQLTKIEEGLCSGPVPYHKFVKKSTAEVEELDKRKAEEKKHKDAMKKKLHFQKEAKKKIPKEKFNTSRR